MGTHTYSFKTQDNLTLQAQGWLPESSPKAIILLIHGLGEHINRYEYWANLFNKSGIGLLAYNQRGHGTSEGQRGHTPAYHYLLDDLHLFLDITIKEFPNIPIFLYGHSFGGNVVTNYILKKDTSYIEGAIISSPWLKIVNEPPAIIKGIARLVSQLYPKLSQPNGLNPQDISSDTEVVQKYINDPLNHNRITVKLFTEAYNAGLEAIQNAAKLSIPVLLMHGTADNITNPKGSKEFAQKAGNRVTLKLWEGFRHEPHNEPQNTDVFNFVYDWVVRHLQ